MDNLMEEFDSGQKLKRCGRCKEYLTPESFNKDRKSKDGLQSFCRKCRKELYNLNKEKNSKIEKKWRASNNIRIWAMQSRNNHKRRDIKIEITIDELEELGKEALIKGCYYCGNEMEVRSAMGKAGVFSPYSMTVDLNDSNEKIMSVNNVKILCYSCNAGKGPLSHEEYIFKCKKVIEKWKELLDNV